MGIIGCPYPETRDDDRPAPRKMVARSRAPDKWLSAFAGDQRSASLHADSRAVRPRCLTEQPNERRMWWSAGAVARVLVLGKEGGRGRSLDPQLEMLHIAPRPPRMPRRGVPSTLLVHSTPGLRSTPGFGALCTIETPRSRRSHPLIKPRTSPGRRRPAPGACRLRAGPADANQLSADSASARVAAAASVSSASSISLRSRGIPARLIRTS